MNVLGADEDDAEVPLSPLIDCVFLLLIFFLVATMLKRWEMQIPVEIPDATSSLSPDPDESAYLLAVNLAGDLFHQSGRTPSGFPVFDPIDIDFPSFLSALAAEEGAGKALRILAERNVPFQTVIDLLDHCQHAGFARTDLKLLRGKVRLKRS